MDKKRLYTELLERSYSVLSKLQLYFSTLNFGSALFCFGFHFSLQIIKSYPLKMCYYNVTIKLYW